MKIKRGIVIVLICSIALSLATVDAFINVPYQSQPQNSSWCGPASLTMVFTYWGMNISQTAVAFNIYNSTVYGTYPDKMVSYPDQIGFNSTAFTGTIPLLKHYTDQGYPLIVEQNYTTTSSAGHYRVVVGVDVTNKWVVTDGSVNSSSVVFLCEKSSVCIFVMDLKRFCQVLS